MIIFAGLSILQIISSSIPNNLPPTLTHEVETISPFLDIAMFDVPPPMSTDNIVFCFIFD